MAACNVLQLKQLNEIGLKCEARIIPVVSIPAVVRPTWFSCENRWINYVLFVYDLINKMISMLDEEIL